MFACKCLIAKDPEYDDTLGKDHLFKIKGSYIFLCIKPHLYCLREVIIMSKRQRV